MNVLYEDRTGQIWAGTDGGLCRLSEANGKALLEPVALGVPSRPDRALAIWALAEDSSGSLWMGTSWGLVRRRNDGRTTHYGIQPLRGFDHVRTVQPDGQNRLWIGHDTGLIVFRPDDSESSRLDSAIRFTTADGLSAERLGPAPLS